MQLIPTAYCHRMADPLKDGISAAAVLAEYGGWLYSQGKTFGDQLEL